MAPGLWSDRISSLAETLKSRQMKSGGWAYFDSVQESLEATCLAELALAPERQASSSAAILFLLKSQLSDGGWPAFLGDSEGSWTTALALCTLNSTGDFTAAREKAFRWLYAERGREGHWFWRWKFKTSDRNVRFDPDKYGWPWVTGSASWVIPTAFSIIAIEQFTVCNRSDPIGWTKKRASLDGGAGKSWGGPEAAVHSGLARRSGRIPALPYPPRKQNHCTAAAENCKTKV